VNRTDRKKRVWQFFHRGLVTDAVDGNADTSPLAPADVAEVVTASLVLLGSLAANVEGLALGASSHVVVAYLLKWGSRPEDGYL
jgi:hypothetical protein